MDFVVRGLDSEKLAVQRSADRQGGAGHADEQQDHLARAESLISAVAAPRGWSIMSPASRRRDCDHPHASSCELALGRSFAGSVQIAVT